MAEAKEEGPYYAINQSLEIAFATYKLHGNALELTERGTRLAQLIKIMKDVMKKLSDSERKLFVDVWVERLIVAAKSAGATV